VENTATVDELRKIKALEGLSDASLAWLFERCEYRSYQQGEYLAHAGDPADYMLFLLEGTIHARNENSDVPAFIMTAGMVSGFLPFSRMANFPLATRAQSPLRLLALHKQHFPALYQEVPELIPKLVGILTDRVRESTRAITQTDKLAAIGKLTAGLAHELNNPAAAARQASGSAKQIFDCYRDTLDQLAAQCASKEIYEQVRQLEAQASGALRQPQVMDSLLRSDLEETIVEWLESIGIEDPWRGAPAFVNAGFTVESLEKATAGWSAEVRELALYRMAAAIEMEQVLGQMHNATTRMSDLVGAMKDYSFMDRAGKAEVDINQNVESTIALFGFRFKSGVELIKTYAADLPKVCGQGGQLNQVWTNLIDNALDAIEMEKDRTEPGQLRIETKQELDQILVEITDNGPGIPDTVASKIFDPFFTTKEQGDGTGLGLDTVYRIIRQHEGDIRFQSAPGKTTFSVRLPIPRPA
jgi:signal transduction histidine kinase